MKEKLYIFYVFVFPSCSLVQCFAIGQLCPLDFIQSLKYNKCDIAGEYEFDFFVFLKVPEVCECIYPHPRKLMWF